MYITLKQKRKKATVSRIHKKNRKTEIHIEFYLYNLFRMIEYQFLANVQKFYQTMTH